MSILQINWQGPFTASGHRASREFSTSARSAREWEGSSRYRTSGAEGGCCDSLGEPPSSGE